MKSSYRKYNQGGPVKPRKKQKVYTDRGLYEKALKAYQDSLALNNYYKLQQEVEPEGVYNVQELGYKGALDKAAADIKAGKVDTNKYNVLREYGDRVIDESGGTIQWINRGSSPDLQYYDYSDDKSKNFMLRFGHQMGKMITGDDKDNLFYGSSKGWFGDAYNAFWPEPNVEPVYLREDGLKELPPRILEAKAPKPRKEYKGMLVDPLLKESRVKEGIIELPPKLPFNSMNLSKTPALRRVLPEIYSRKMDASGTKVIYETSEGRVVKKKGQESAQYEYLNRAAINRMRQNR